MKGTISPQMRALLNNRELYEKFNSKLLSCSPREPFCVEDDLGNKVCYTPYPNIKNYKSNCCQKCGENIGYIGRFFQFLRIPLHRCEK